MGSEQETVVKLRLGETGHIFKPKESRVTGRRRWGWKGKD